MSSAPEERLRRVGPAALCCLLLQTACVSNDPSPLAGPVPGPDTAAASVESGEAESRDPKIARLEAALANRPQDAELMRELAETWMERGDELLAAEWLRKATSHAPGDAELWVRLGDVEERAGRHAAAIRALDRALEIEPAWIEVARRRDDLAVQLIRSENRPQVSAPAPR